MSTAGESLWRPPTPAAFPSGASPPRGGTKLKRSGSRSFFTLGERGRGRRVEDRQRKKERGNGEVEGEAGRGSASRRERERGSGEVRLCMCLACSACAEERLVWCLRVRPRECGERVRIRTIPANKTDKSCRAPARSRSHRPTGLGSARRTSPASRAGRAQREAGSMSPPAQRPPPWPGCHLRRNGRGRHRTRT